MKSEVQIFVSSVLYVIRTEKCQNKRIKRIRTTIQVNDDGYITTGIFLLAAVE